MPKVEMPDGLHKEVKKFAVEHDLSIKDAYAKLVQYSLEQKHDKHALKKILNEKGADSDIIVGS
ncbi:MAG: hypothetical protein WBZ29_09735 [Methanocella sp.]